MLRGLTRSGVPVTGAQFIDILKQRSPRVLNNASGDMLARLRSPRSHQALAGVRGRLPSKEGAVLDSAEWFAWHRSQIPVLHLRYEQVTHRLSPRSRDRGPIEATN
jgi:hypothetical protein